MKDAPTYNLGTLEYKGEEIDFYYPAEFSWSCTECGACCRDMSDRERRILLTDKDIKKIEETGKESFYEETDDLHFTGIMKMEEGRCIFLDGVSCEIYEKRALLCRTYPFWIERKENMFMIRADSDCPGVGEGDKLGEEFFKKLLRNVLDHMEN
jgi:Fe-S-cluster containining protein